MTRLALTPYQPLMQWMIFIGVLILAAVVAWDQGLFHLLLESDRSRISIVILVAFCGVPVHAALRLAILSRELEQVNEIRLLLERSTGKKLRLNAIPTYAIAMEPTKT